MHAACINGHIDIVKVLINYAYPEHVLIPFKLKSGSCEFRLPFNPNIQDITGQTPLYMSCLLGNTELVEVLLNWKVKFTSIVKTVIKTVFSIKKKKNVLKYAFYRKMLKIQPEHQPNEMFPMAYKQLWIVYIRWLYEIIPKK